MAFPSASFPSGLSSQATYWEQRYHKGDTPWNKGGAHPALEEWLRSAGAVEGTRVIVPGCGWGYDVMAWRRAGADAWGLDFSAQAVAGARHLHPGGRFIEGSVFSPPQEWKGGCDWVCEHTCFCAIAPEDRRLYVAGVRELLRVGGKLFAIFYQDPDHEEGPPFGISAGELMAVFGVGEKNGGIFALEDRWVPSLTFPGREQREECWILRKCA